MLHCHPPASNWSALTLTTDDLHDLLLHTSCGRSKEVQSALYNFASRLLRLSIQNDENDSATSEDTAIADYNESKVNDTKIKSSPLPPRDTNGASNAPQSTRVNSVPQSYAAVPSAVSNSGNGGFYFDAMGNAFRLTPATSVPLTPVGGHTQGQPGDTVNLREGQPWTNATHYQPSQLSQPPQASQASGVRPPPMSATGPHIVRPVPDPTHGSTIRPPNLQSQYQSTVGHPSSIKGGASIAPRRVIPSEVSTASSQVHPIEHLRKTLDEYTRSVTSQLKDMESIIRSSMPSNDLASTLV